ncbi:XrtA/PEP-CTERM system TPR-repeat protein PrsT [Motilimonas pumila]|uniref:PEP-CTERM system TPR-repeat protein PrsT n=1 Tax=Motilimonas pumila TaxID=2303987 RepID=A0A418YIC8_9GAMM|nr:XrtA/PEP-CTERM system TPR-repeat protein PrsT [Motilimonas pumila]RJG50406.1 PEP-CTERM system TPR-repeat protein PrsT [Motilimonas pumila]
MKLATLGLIACITLLGCSKDPQQDDIQQAQQALAKNAYQQAGLHLKNHIKQQPEDAFARYLLGQVYLSQKHYPAATKELQLALSLQYSEAASALAQAYFETGAYQEVLAIQPLPQWSEQVRCELLLLQVDAALSMQQVSIAEQLLADLTGKPVEQQLGHAMISLQQQNWQQSLQYLAAIDSDQYPWQRQWLAVNAYMQGGQYDNAIEGLHQLHQHDPQQLRYSLLLTDAALAKLDFELAKQSMAASRQLSPKHVQLIFQQAYLAFLQQDFNRAINESGILLSQVEHHPGRVINGLAHYYLGHWEQAYNQLNKVATQLPADHLVQRVMVDILLKLGQVEQSADLATHIHWQDVNQLPLLLTLVTDMKSRASQGKPEQVERALLNNLKQLQPEAAEQLLQLGLAQVMLGDEQDGQEVIEQALQQQAQLNEREARLLFSYYVKTQQLSAALQVADKLPSEQASLQQHMRALVMLKQMDYAGAEQALRQARELSPDNLHFAQLLALCLYRQQHWLALAKLMEQVLPLAPLQPQLLYFATMADLERQQSSAAIKRLETAAQQSQVAPQSLLLLADVYQSQGDFSSAQALLLTMPTEMQQNPAWLLLAAQGAAELLQWQQAEVFYRDLLLVSPQQFTLYLALQQTMRAQQRQLEFARFLPEWPPQHPLYNDMSRLRVAAFIDAQQYEIARGLLSAAAGLRGKHQQSWLELEVDLLLAEKQFDKALALLEQLQQDYQSNQYLLKRYAVYQRQGQQGTGAKILQAWLVQRPRDTKVQLALAQSLLLQQDYQQAEQVYLSLLELRPNALVVLNNLAWLKHLAGQPEAGMAWVKQGLALYPDNAELIDTHGVLLIDSEQYAAAQAILQPLVEADPKGEYLFHLAQAYYGGNDFVKARRVLQQLFAQQQAFPSQQQAQALKALLDAI